MWHYCGVLSRLDVEKFPQTCPGAAMRLLGPFEPVVFHMLSYKVLNSLLPSTYS